MKLKPIKSNMTEVTLTDGTKVLFSYETPVACMNLSPDFHREHGACCLKTSRKWSVTTSRHINQWLDGAKALEKPQEFFDKLA